MNDFSSEPSPQACAQARTALSMRHDDELVDAAALDAHFAACAECRAYEAQLVAVDDAWGELREATPAVDLWPAIERGTALNESAGSTSSARPARLRFLARAAAALIGFLGVAWLALAHERPGTATTDPDSPLASIHRLARADAAAAERERRFLQLLSHPEVTR